MAQELGIVEKDENYVNPYRADQRMVIAVGSTWDSLKAN